ncbi:MAG TPA: ATP-binding protein [Candidatus Thermoplasmatota archaeon]|nr:ATP-binding protein [Candidatus Thermoplasmatota archaeon]
MAVAVPGMTRLRERLTGPLALVAVLVACEALARTPWAIPNPTPILLLVVVYSAFVDPRWKAIVVSLLGVIYTAIYFSRPGALFGYAGDDFYRVAVMALVAPTMAWMTASLNERTLALERELAARQRAERERDLVRHVIERAPVAVLVTRGESHEVALANASSARLVGLPTEALQNRPLRDVLPRMPDAFWSAMGAALADGGSWSRADLAVERLDAQTRTVEASLSPLEDAEGRRTGVLVMMADITDRRTAEAALAAARVELNRSERLVVMGTMVSGLAHEIRTPLTFIANHLSVLRSALGRAQREGPLPAPLQQAEANIDEALAGVERVNGLVVDLRRFVRTEPAERRQVRLDEQVQEALHLFEVANRGRIIVERDLRPCAPILAEPLQLQQIVLNLLENAATASPPGGRVYVSTVSEERAATLSVRDEGVGMLPEVRARVFEPFFTTRDEGTGLGLAIVRRLVEAHGARIEVESEAGRGSTFRVRFPLGAREVPVSAPARSARELTSG